MPKIDAFRISHRMPKRYKGATIDPAQSIAVQARRIFATLPGPKAKVNPHGLDQSRFEEGIRRALRWEEFRTGFQLGEEVTLSSYTIAKILSLEIFSPSSDHGPIYQREEVIDLAEARVWLRRFLYVMEHLWPPEELDLSLDPKTFFVRGPAERLSLGLESDPHFTYAALPGFNLRAGEFCYVKPVADNLALLQLRVLDPEERLIRKYAYDRSMPGRFSIYTYRKEERRQFDILNQALLSPGQREEQRKNIQLLKEICQKLINRDPKPKQPLPLPIRFSIAGPARHITLDLGKGKRITFARLHIDPHEVYEVEITVGNFPHSEQKTLVVKFRKSGSKKLPDIYYFDPRSDDFIQILERKMDRTGRTSVPRKFIPRVWDDEGNRGIVL